MKILNIQKLENLILANWADIMDIRKLIAFANQYIVPTGIEPTDTLTLSRCEPSDGHFIVWIDCISTKSSVKVNVTIEALLKLSGELQFVRLDY